MTEDLATWLLEQIAEDERVAGANAVDLWPGGTLQKVAENKTHYAWQPHDVSPQRIAHILHFDPRRELAECDAKRRIIASCEGLLEFADQHGNAAIELAARTLRLLGLSMADRPGYQEAWRP